MLFFLDSADLSLIESSLRAYPLAGVTTNPAILARDIPEGMSVKEALSEIRRLTAGKTMFVQVTSEDTAGMIADAKAIRAAFDGDLSIKIPATKAGIEAIKVLSGEGFHLTATAVYSPSQCLLAAAAGADFAAPYISHLDNLSFDGADFAAEMAQQLAYHGMDTQVLGASFRTVAQVERAIAGGVTSVTVTADMLDQLASHLGTDKELAGFRAKWGNRFGKPIAELLK